MFISMATLIILGIILFMRDSEASEMESEIRDNRQKIEQLEDTIIDMKWAKEEEYSEYSSNNLWT